MKQIVVFFVLFYIRIAAQLQIKKIHPKVIGVAGSSGKTSLVELLRIVLSQKFRVKATGGQNSEVGLPLNILDIAIYDNSPLDWIRILLLVPIQLMFNWKQYDIFVAEMGIDSPVEPKNMQYLLKIVQPSIALTTNVSLEHSVYFEPYVEDAISQEEKQRKVFELTAIQETMIMTTLDINELAIVNLDDEWIQKYKKEIIAKTITISIDNKASLQAKKIKNDLSSFSMDILFKEDLYPLVIAQPLPKHFGYEFLFALAVGIALDIPIENAILSLEKNFSLPNGRLGFFKGIKDSILIDSTYNNATLPPILDILDLVKEISGKRRKVAILGDMRELGNEAEDIHKAVAQKIIETMDFVVLIGPLSEQYIIPILKKVNFPFEDFPDISSSKQSILKMIKSDDVILVKGSQNTLFLERIVEMLLANKEDASKLTRRGEFWDKKRAETR